jgi:hypothetical protein
LALQRRGATRCSFPRLHQRRFEPVPSPMLTGSDNMLYNLQLGRLDVPVADDVIHQCEFHYVIYTLMRAVRGRGPQRVADPHRCAPAQLQDPFA